MEENAQFDVFLEVLCRFDREGVLPHMMLIGSWCLPLYRSALSQASQLPLLRTLDADFLIPDPTRIKRDVDVPTVLQELGFTPTLQAASHWVVYDHPELRVEFLIPELGKGRDRAHEVRKLHLQAQGLRYVSLLADYPRMLSYSWAFSPRS